MTFSTLKDVIKDAFAGIEKRSDKKKPATGVPAWIVGHGVGIPPSIFFKKKPATGVPAGFHDIDTLTSGFQRSDLIVIAGRPSMGKTTFCLNIAAHAAIEKKLPVAVLSLDLTKEEVVQRMLSSESKVSLNKIKTGSLNDEEWGLLTGAVGHLYKAPVYVDDAPVRRTDRMDGLMKQLKEIKRDSGIKLVIVDFLQLFAGKPGENHFVAAESLKNIAKALDVPVIAVSRLPRFEDGREDCRPALSDLRRCNMLIERYADVVMFVHRDSMYNPCKCPRKKCSCGKRNAVEVIIERNRNGPTGSVNLFFNHEIVRLENISDK
ncbi:MAG: AAA family ATPase [Deltaproteobacteria bacterium]|nr:AAA family ATPase [Deltaproteobacteria bacterium]